MNLLNELAKHHNEWIKIVRSFGESNFHEDIVQEMYLRANKYVKADKVFQDGKLNKSFFWFMLRNIHVDICKQRTKVEKTTIDGMVIISELSEVEKHEAYKRLLAKMDAEIDTWHWYDKMLFIHYRDSGKSLRKLANDTGISLRSIFHTISTCKHKLNKAVSEDYADYKNRDFELI